MAHAAVSWVLTEVEYPKEVAPATRWLLVVMADHASVEDWTLFHSHKTLANDAGMSTRSVLSHLAILEDAGLIGRAERFRDDGTRTTDMISLSGYAGFAGRRRNNGGDQPQKMSRQTAKSAAHNHGSEAGKIIDMATVVALSPKADASDARQAFDMFNVLIRTLNDDVPLSLKRSVAMELTASRRQHLNARLRECGGLDGWVEALDRVARSPFLSGRIRGRHGQFAISLDFILQPSSFTKLREGIYDGERQSTHAPGGGGSPGGGERNAAMFAGARAAVERHERERGRGGGA